MKEQRQIIGTRTWLTRKYHHKKENAKRRGIGFELSKEEFKILVRNDCFYCGNKPTGHITIDRKNNSMGYTIANCVAACFLCNTRKRSIPEIKWNAYKELLNERRILNNKIRELMSV